MKTYAERTQSILNKAEKLKAARSLKIKIASVLSCALASVLALDLVLFIPYQIGGVDITSYSNSEYFPLIKQLSELTYAPRTTTNNFKQWFGSLNKGFGAESPDEGTSLPPTSPDDTPDYDDVTLNQTENVSEGDLFKRNARHIFYLGFKPGKYDYIFNGNDGAVKVETYEKSSYIVRAYTVDGENSTLAAEYEIGSEDGMKFDGYGDRREMFVSADGKNLTVLSPCYDTVNNVLYTAAVRLDVSDVTNIKETARVYASGNYVSARVADDTLLLISNFSVPRNVDFSNEIKYIPRYGTVDNMTPVAAADIVLPSNATVPNYTVIYSVDCATLETTDAVALLSYSDDVYVSQNNLFATHGYLQNCAADDKYNVEYSLDRTEIRIVSYGDGKLENSGAIDVDGTVLNRYCLDEYDGILRAVTTATYRNASYVGTGVTEIDKNFPATECNLYCYDIATLERIATVENFAPLGESVKSARFDGDTAYVCTAEDVLLTDPVYEFDLSDYGNITSVDTGTIPGYSLSLARFKDGTLLGIGYGDDIRTLKIELYTRNGNSVVSVAQYELVDVVFSSEFKAHFIDAKNGLVGLAVTTLYDGKTHYKLMRFDGYELVEILSVETETLLHEARAAYIDGYVYIFGNSSEKTDFKAIRL